MLELSKFLLEYFFTVVLGPGIWAFLIVAFCFGTVVAFHEDEWGWFGLFLTLAIIGVVSIPLLISVIDDLHNRVVDKKVELPTELVAIENRRYKLLEINPPKHMRVRLQDVQSGYSAWASVSKHCNNWRDNEIGAEYNIDVKVLRKGDREWREFTGLSKVFC